MSLWKEPESLELWTGRICDKAVKFANMTDTLPPQVIGFAVKDGRMVKHWPLDIDAMMQGPREVLRALLHAFLTKVGADGYFLVTEAWMAQIPMEEWDGKIPSMKPSEHPDRMSVLRVEARMRDGEALCRLLKQSNLAGDRFTGEWQSTEAINYGDMANFFQLAAPYPEVGDKHVVN